MTYALGRPITRLTAVMSTAAFAGLLMTGCGAPPKPATGRAAAARCTESGAATAKTPTIAILGDVGSSTIQYTSDVNLVVKAGTNKEAWVLVNGIGKDNNAPDKLASVVLKAKGRNELMRTNDMKCKKTAVTTAYSSLSRLSAPKPLNVFAALGTLAGNLHGSKAGGPVNVVLLGSLLNTTADADLSEATVLANPAKAINELAKEQLVESCKGWNVYAVGADQANPPLTSAQSAQLREFWREYFQHCGGRLVVWSDHLTTFPVNSSIAQADTTQIKIETTPHEVVATMSSDVLFAPNSAALQPTASKDLSQVLAPGVWTRSVSAGSDSIVM
ncbi:hypothetical protein [Leekyejoonella antrihumi]|uniref:SGNH/GDSL hydrolase family protein n=1 Tax=Leekyejoonella antrihumi TaxID=1660198 RepID=A0A563DWV7_9MICO|nr:hypothetical protein [Leekyejoonella antrihumi]TWP34422.1 hypothetical protein FGL98_17790 [Leekyejoonella antrihumi]